MGMPSVMHTTSPIPASIASRIASAANGPGTKMSVVFAPVSATALTTLLNNGRPKAAPPPRPGCTPPTKRVPYSIACSAWNLPLDSLYYLVRGVCHVLSDEQGQTRVSQDLSAFLHIRAFHTHHDWHLHLYLGHRLEYPLGKDITAQNTTKDIDQDGLHVRIGHQQTERILDRLSTGTTTHIQKIRWGSAGKFDDVHCRHRQASPIDNATDIAGEFYIVEFVSRSLDFQGVFLSQIPQRHHIGLTEEGVVIELHFDVQDHRRPGRGQPQRINFQQCTVPVMKDAIQFLQQEWQIVLRCSIDLELLNQTSGLERCQTQQDIDRFTQDFVWIGHGNSFDVHPPYGAHNAQRLP